ncbi:aminoglycoside phosphotransferase family protein [Kribbella sandramycini]|uniref:Aminoglycoside phosphotransferase (APT) family kinase protein n=1 Tax=Kribbella sandramycini TaxID=60450 RepID=A0A7Y4P1D3_9ACTN|nr:aminoglycoside phosphotransferase family protein [Kribbella sandramycini]MBB6565786.1 aminoglycoside phosphotransferase (APT) family kinase protein [Kribbella sandramycini]NOL42050.1 aminoglycoside phosphotransferase family protein [Kribbella sandramycini]
MTFTKRFSSWSRAEPDREWATLTALSRARPSLVPSPLRRGTDWVEMTHLPGLPLSAPLTRRQLPALGDALQLLWSVPPADLLPLEVPSLLTRTADGLAILRSRAGVIGSAAAEAADWLDQASGLADVHDPVVGHGDPNLANYLWDGECVRIIDFEDAGLGDRTFELANLVEHLAGRGTLWNDLLERFPVDPTRLHAARCLWAAFWLVLIGPGGPSAQRNPSGTADAQARRLLGLIRVRG